MSPRIAPYETYAATPWKNGGGVTHEIARFGDGAEQWRVSLATIDRDGPFSDFGGYDRTIVPVEGAGFELALDGVERVRLDRLYHPFAFAGERRVDCRLLDGPSRDLNALSLRSLWRHDLRSLALTSAPRTLDVRAPAVAFFTGAAVVTHDGIARALGPFDSAICEEDVRFELHSAQAPAHVLLVRFIPRA
jgi:environmental stress-induced protein Ves